MEKGVSTSPPSIITSGDIPDGQSRRETLYCSRIKSCSSIPGHWPTWRRLILGNGLVCVTTVKTERGTYLRPLTRLVPLLSEGEGNIDQTFAGGGGGGGEDVQDSKSLHQRKKTCLWSWVEQQQRESSHGERRKNGRRSSTHELMYYTCHYFTYL